MLIEASLDWLQPIVVKERAALLGALAYQTQMNQRDNQAYEQGESALGCTRDSPPDRMDWSTKDMGKSTCSRLLTFGEFGEAEIQNLHDAVAPQHDIFRLYVTMHDSCGVRCRKS